MAKNPAEFTARDIAALIPHARAVKNILILDARCFKHGSTDLKIFIKQRKRLEAFAPNGNTDQDDSTGTGALSEVAAP